VFEKIGALTLMDFFPFSLKTPLGRRQFIIHIRKIKRDTDLLRQIQTICQRFPEEEKSYFVKGLIDAISVYLEIRCSLLVPRSTIIEWRTIFGPDPNSWKPDISWTRWLYLSNVSYETVETALSVIDFPSADEREYAVAAAVLLT